MNIFKRIFNKSDKELFDKVAKNYLRIIKDLEVIDIKVEEDTVSFKIVYKGSVIPFWTKLELAEALSIISLGLAFGFNLVEMSQFVKNPDLTLS